LDNQPWADYLIGRTKNSAFTELLFIGRPSIRRLPAGRQGSSADEILSMGGKLGKEGQTQLSRPEKESS